VPDTYHVVLEAFNNYYSRDTGIPGRIVKELVVKPASGYPHPLPEEQFVQIPAGTYPFGALACPPEQQCGATDWDETLDDTLMVRITNAYHIDKYEVTNALYLKYLNSALGADTLITYDQDAGEVRSQIDGRILIVLDPAMTRLKVQFSDSTFWADDRYLQHPVTGVTWYGAGAYAAFYGLRLPTEAEWEIAARGGYIAPGPIYPWDPPGTIDPSHANYLHSGDPYEQGTATGQTNPVDGYNGLGMEGFPTLDAVSPSGTYGQAGNVAEWTKDWYSDLTYTELYRSYSASGSPPLDPQGPSKDSGATQRVLRGGSFVNWRWELRVTNRMATDPFTRTDWIGFRTAYIDF
jgi:formylglycine-generating enzyme required for sulfatase activity